MRKYYPTSLASAKNLLKLDGLLKSTGPKQFSTFIDWVYRFLEEEVVLCMNGVTMAPRQGDYLGVRFYSHDEDFPNRSSLLENSSKRILVTGIRGCGATYFMDKLRIWNVDPRLLHDVYNFIDGDGAPAVKASQLATLSSRASENLYLDSTWLNMRQNLIAYRPSDVVWLLPDPSVFRASNYLKARRVEDSGFQCPLLERLSSLDTAALLKMNIACLTYMCGLTLGLENVPTIHVVRLNATGEVLSPNHVRHRDLGKDYSLS